MKQLRITTMKKIILSIAILILAYGCTNQVEKGQNAKSSFYIDKPENWYSQSDETIYDNLSKFEFSDAELNKILKTHGGSVPLLIYTKYKPEDYEGIIPTIQINLRPNQTDNFAEFKESIIQSAKQLKNIFNNFEYIDEPHEIEIAGIKSIYFKSKFDLQLQNGEITNVRSWNYAIPTDDYFYQVNFSDAFEKDDSSEIYEELIKSIKFVSNKK